MNVCREYINRHKAISWVLLAVLLVQIIFPLHFHLHHDTNSEINGHQHIVDSHVLTDTQGTQHLADEDTHIIKTTPDVISKQNTDTGFDFVLLVSLLIVLSIVPLIISRLRQTIENSFRSFYYYDLAPPLRAPPAI
jgi:hypothetical protein